MTTQLKYQIGTKENRQFLETARNELLSFGHQFPSPEGSSYYLGDDGTPWKDRSRETWITSRMAHVYSLGCFLGHDGSKELATAAIHGLCTELHDEKNGGWYAGLTADGEVLPTKQCYAHAFVILAASSGMLAGIEGAKELLEEALALYDLRFWNEAEGLSCDTWNTEFTKLDDYRGLNANMHTVEAFLAAADVTGDEKYRVRAGRIIDHVLGWAKENDWRIPEHFHKGWTPDLECNREHPDDPFKPYGATPGHGIEWARLILQMYCPHIRTVHLQKLHRMYRQQKHYITVPLPMPGTSMAHRDWYIPQTGTENLSFMTECTGLWRKRSIPLLSSGISPEKTATQRTMLPLCSIWMTWYGIMIPVPGFTSLIRITSFLVLYGRESPTFTMRSRQH